MAIAISTPDAPPSAEQLATIERLLLSQIARLGFGVAKDPASADYVMRVRFIPNIVNPPGGHLTFLAIERNQSRVINRGENPAAEASANALAELRRTAAETEWLNAASK